MQFHPEVTHTHQGARDHRLRFVRIEHLRPRAARLEHGDYVAEAVVAQVRAGRRDEGHPRPVGRRRFSVVAALLHRAIGDQLTCVFVDNGLLRLNEGDMVMEMFARNLGVKVIRVDATEQFMGQRWPGVSDPEAKRKIIGREFVEVFQAEAEIAAGPLAGPGHDLPGRHRVGRRKTGKAHTIKSHHNVGGLPRPLT